MNTQKKKNTKKRNSQKESVPVSPALYHGIFMLKSNVDTPIKLDTIMCGMGQHGQRLNTGTCFSVSSDDKLVLFLFHGIPKGDPAIVAFYDKRIYKKLRLKDKIR
jgi:hypothetical protein